MTRPDRKVTFVVFSDYPCRQSMRCGIKCVFSSLGCKPEPGIEDDRVSLFAAMTEILPSIQDIGSKRQIFDLAAY